MHYKINLREERDFGQKINAVFTFLQQNFKPLFKSLLFIVGPTTLLAGIFLGLHQSKVIEVAFDRNPGTFNNYRYFQDIFSSNYFLAILFMFISFILVYQVVYGYLVHYLEDKDQIITTEMIWGHVKKKLLYSVFAMFGLSIMIFIGFFIFLIPGIYLMIAFQLALIIIAMEDISFFDLISRCFNLISGKWWSTFGLLFIVMIIQSMMGIVFNIPTYIFTFAKAFHLGEGSNDNNIFLVLSTVFSTVGTLLLYTLSALAIAFQYFNLVERKEGVGLLEEVDQLGKQTSNDDEGDY